MENIDNSGQVTQNSVPKQALPNAGGILAMGIISIAVCWCYGIFGITLGIIALIMANKSIKLYNENPSLYTEGSFKNVNAGRICGIIGLCVSSLYIIALIIYFVIVGSLIFSALPFMK